MPKIIAKVMSIVAVDVTAPYVVRKGIVKIKKKK